MQYLAVLAKTVIIVALICEIVNSFCTLFCKINRISAIFYPCLCLFYRGDSAYCYFVKKCYKIKGKLIFCHKISDFAKDFWELCVLIVGEFAQDKIHVADASAELIVAGAKTEAWEIFGAKM